MRAAGKVRSGSRTDRTVSSRQRRLRLTIGAGLEGVDFHLSADGVDDPVFRHAVPREHLHLSAAVDGGGGGREHLYDDIGRSARHGVRVEQVQPFGPEENDVRLHDVVFVEHDVERCRHREPARYPPVVVQQRDELHGGNLMPQQRRRDHDQLPSVDLVPAPVIRHLYKVAVADPRRRILHGHHRITRMSMRNACRRAARGGPRSDGSCRQKSRQGAAGRHAGCTTPPPLGGLV